MEGKFNKPKSEKGEADPHFQDKYVPDDLSLEEVRKITREIASDEEGE